MRLLLIFLLVGCGGVVVKKPKPVEIGVDDTTTDPDVSVDADTDGPDAPEETQDSETPEESVNELGSGKVHRPQATDTVCRAAIPAGFLDLAIQKDGAFYDTSAKIVLNGRTSIGDEDVSERLTYGSTMRMWVKIPPVIRPTKGRGNKEVELCLTVGNVNCRYIWGAKVFELDACDLGVSVDDIVGARFFSLEVHNSDIAPDVMVRAELEALTDVR